MIGAKFTYLVDSTSRTAKDIIQNGRFEVQKQNVANFGITKSIIWVKAKLINSSPKNYFKLILSYPILDEITFFFPENKVYKNLKAHDACGMLIKGFHWNKRDLSIIL